MSKPNKEHAMRILFIFLFTLFVPLSLAEDAAEDAGLQPCKNLKGLERSECRSLQELKNAGESVPKLPPDGLSCVPAQTLSSAQREWCTLKESIEKKRNPQEKEISRSAQKAQNLDVKSRGVRGAFAEKAEEKKQMYDALIQDQLRGRQSNLDRTDVLQSHARIRQEKRGALPETLESNPATNTYRANSIQRGKLRYIRTRPTRVQK